ELIAVLCVVSFLIALTIRTPDQGNLRSQRKKNTNSMRSMKPETKLG
ncbi:oxalate/formate antiport family MFS transporter, partial [Paenibacillus sp. 28ISP30-2]|nr:oxalate/formate antiport family MFS transporter [Paenibacillus sp. 28ISP30-2]